MKRTFRLAMVTLVLSLSELVDSQPATEITPTEEVKTENNQPPSEPATVAEGTGDLNESS